MVEREGERGRREGGRGILDTLTTRSVNYAVTTYLPVGGVTVVPTKSGPSDAQLTKLIRQRPGHTNHSHRLTTPQRQRSLRLSSMIANRASFVGVHEEVSQ